MSYDMLPVGEIDTKRHSILQADATNLPYDDESFHAIVTDPPYGLAFMGKTWDDFEPKEYQLWCEEWASETLRVLKPGGHMLAFSGNRTHHRLFTGVEDAGFEIRDTLTYHYGSGFPKASDISKTIDKRNWNEWLDAHPRVKDHLSTLDVSERQELEAKIKKRADAERQVVGKYESPEGTSGESPVKGRIAGGDNIGGINEITAPATDAAKKWDGWKTGLKPATEFVVMARKPLEEDTVAEQVMATGTGALNIDGTRVGYDSNEPDKRVDGDYKNPSVWSTDGSHEGWRSEVHDDYEADQLYKDEGRYPANIILDIEAAQMLDEEVGESTSAASTQYHEEYGDDSIFMDGVSHPGNQYNDTGGPSRFFYTAKASKSERTANGRIDNPHPTVKPVDLMQYLVRLVTAEGQKVCDPFLGSGTTLLACEEENRVGYGSDMNKEFCDIATKRLGIRLGTELGSFMDY